MKKLFVSVLLAGFCQQCVAQGLGEWFNQKNTQRKYLLEQIAALQVYTGYVRKGYSIAKDGLQTVGSIKDGDLIQHSNYFSSMKRVSPAVRKYPKLQDILNMQGRLAKLIRSSRAGFAADARFSSNELNYIHKVYDRLTDDCNRTLEELEMVITDGEVAMSDDERISKVDTLFEDTRTQYDFGNSFTVEAAQLAKARTAELKGIKDMRSLSGIK